MNTTSLKQKAVMAVLGVVLAYAIVIVMWFVNLDRKMKWCPKSWGDAIRSYETACKTYQNECQLISQKKKWTDAYEDERNKMKRFETGEATDTTWLKILKDFTTANHISTSGFNAGKEEIAGDVTELPIDVPWEGALESLVKFMYDLGTTSEGMFDIRQISIKPSAKRGYLKGSFTLTCAYMRGE